MGMPEDTQLDTSLFTAVIPYSSDYTAPFSDKKKPLEKIIGVPLNETPEGMCILHCFVTGSLEIPYETPLAQSLQKPNKKKVGPKAPNFKMGGGSNGIKL